MQPKVSVIVPIYNVEKYLRECLDSLLAQTLEDIQIILVNDGSTDGSPAIIAEYAARDARIEVIDKPNAGYGHSMNRGLERASGEYIGIVEPDDFIDSAMFADLYAAACSCTPKAQVARSAYWRVMCDGSREFTYPSPHKGRVKPDRQPFTIAECPEMLFYHPSIWAAIYEKAFLDGEGIRFKEIPGAGWSDNPFFIETLGLADRIVYVDECYYHYREDNIDGSSALKDYTIPFDRWNEMQDFIDAHPALATPEVLESQATRGFAYIKGAEKSAGAAQHADEIEERTADLFGRMDRAVVLGSRRIAGDAKRRYLSVVAPGEPLPVLAGGFYRHLVAEFFHTIREGGVGVAAYRVRSFFAKR